MNLHRIHLRESTGGTPVPRQGNRSATAAPSNLYRCRPFGPNDYVYIHVANRRCGRRSSASSASRMLDDPRLADRASG